MLCRLVIRDFVLGLTDVNAAHTCRQWLKDPHPTCTRCRDRNCTRHSTCISCKDWSLTQWTAFDSFNARRSNTDRKRSSNRHAGDSTSLTSQSLSSSAPVKQAAPSLAPPTPPSEGPGIREETKSDKPKRTRVSSSSPLLASQQEEGGGGGGHRQ